MAIENLMPKCPCGGARRMLDRQDPSLTAICETCGQAVLIIRQREFSACIPLCDFHLKRGDGPDRRPLDDLEMAQSLCHHLVLDQWPSPATILDFGIDSSSHLGALQYAVGGGVAPYDLDRVMGDGPAITQLVRSAPRQPYRFVTFKTVWDGGLQLDEED